MALAPPPSRIFSSSLRIWETRSAMKRMLASKRAEVGSTFEGSRLACEVDVVDSLRSAMRWVMKTLYGIPAERERAIRVSPSPKRLTHQEDREISHQCFCLCWAVSAVGCDCLDRGRHLALRWRKSYPTHGLRNRVVGHGIH